MEKERRWSYRGRSTARKVKVDEPRRPGPLTPNQEEKPAIVPDQFEDAKVEAEHQSEEMSRKVEEPLAEQPAIQVGTCLSACDSESLIKDKGDSLVDDDGLESTHLKDESDKVAEEGLAASDHYEGSEFKEEEVLSLPEEHTAPAGHGDGAFEDEILIEESDQRFTESEDKAALVSLTLEVDETADVKLDRALQGESEPADVPGTGSADTRNYEVDDSIQPTDMDDTTISGVKSFAEDAGDADKADNAHEEADESGILNDDLDKSESNLVDVQGEAADNEQKGQAGEDGSFGVDVGDADKTDNTHEQADKSGENSKVPEEVESGILNDDLDKSESNLVEAQGEAADNEQKGQAGEDGSAGEDGFDKDYGDIDEGIGEITEDLLSSISPQGNTEESLEGTKEITEEMPPTVKEEVEAESNEANIAMEPQNSSLGVDLLAENKADGDIQDSRDDSQDIQNESSLDSSKDFTRSTGCESQFADCEDGLDSTFFTADEKNEVSHDSLVEGAPEEGSLQNESSQVLKPETCDEVDAVVNHFVESSPHHGLGSIVDGKPGCLLSTDGSSSTLLAVHDHKSPSGLNVELLSDGLKSVEARSDDSQNVNVATNPGSEIDSMRMHDAMKAFQKSSDAMAGKYPHQTMRIRPSSKVSHATPPYHELPTQQRLEDIRDVGQRGPCPFFAPGSYDAHWKSRHSDSHLNESNMSYLSQALESHSIRPEDKMAGIRSPTEPTKHHPSTPVDPNSTDSDVIFEPEPVEFRTSYFNDNFDFIQFSDDGQLLVGTSDMTRKRHEGSVWWFEDSSMVLGTTRNENSPSFRYWSGISSGAFINQGSQFVVGLDNCQTDWLQIVKEGTSARMDLVGTIEKRDHSVCDISVSYDRATLATACDDQSISIYDLDTSLTVHKFDKVSCGDGVSVHRLKHYYGGAHTRNVIKKMEFHPNQSSVFASCSLDGEILLWDLRLPRPASVMYKAPLGLSTFSWTNNNDCTLALGHSSGLVEVIDMRKTDEGVIRKKQLFTRAVHRLVPAKHNSSWIAACADQTAVYVFDLSKDGLPTVYGDNRHTGFVRGLAWHPTTNQLLSCGYAQQAFLHDVCGFAEGKFPSMDDPSDSSSVPEASSM